MKPLKVRTILPVSLSGLLFLETALLAGLLMRRSWQRSVSGSPVLRGQRVAERAGCFGCHGPEGRGLVPNPRSYQGYVAPWDGRDCEELVRDEQEFRQWVRKGIPDRFKANPAGRFFLERAPVKMPAYGDRISDSELDALFAYVQWVRDNPCGLRGQAMPREGDDGGAKEASP